MTSVRPQLGAGRVLGPQAPAAPPSATPAPVDGFAQVITPSTSPTAFPTAGVATPGMNAATLAMLSRPEGAVAQSARPSGVNRPAPRSPESERMRAFVAQQLGANEAEGWDDLGGLDQLLLYARAAEARIIQNEPATARELAQVQRLDRDVARSFEPAVVDMWQRMTPEQRIPMSRQMLARRVQDATHTPLDWNTVALQVSPTPLREADLAAARERLDANLRAAIDNEPISDTNRMATFATPTPELTATMAQRRWDIAQLAHPSIDVSHRVPPEARAQSPEALKRTVAERALLLARFSAPPAERAALEAFAASHGLTLPPMDPIAELQANVGGSESFQRLELAERERLETVGTVLRQTQQLPRWREMSIAQRSELMEQVHLKLQIDSALALRDALLSAN